jgi:hypothetical protein
MVWLQEAAEWLVSEFKIPARLVQTRDKRKPR